MSILTKPFIFDGIPSLDSTGPDPLSVRNYGKDFIACSKCGIIRKVNVTAIKYRYNVQTYFKYQEYCMLCRVNKKAEMLERNIRHYKRRLQREEERLLIENQSKAAREKILKKRQDKDTTYKSMYKSLRKGRKRTEKIPVTSLPGPVVSADSCPSETL